MLNLLVSYKLQRKLNYKKRKKQNKRWMKTDHADIFSGLSINSVRLFKKTFVYFISQITKTEGKNQGKKVS